MPSSEGQVRALLAGWGVSILPELLVRSQIAQGQIVNVAPAYALPIQLYWHCWNLESDVLDALSAALMKSAAASLKMQPVAVTERIPA